jgi:hypothetical protein
MKRKRASLKREYITSEISKLKHTFREESGPPPRVEVGVWRSMLLKNLDNVLVGGKKRQIKAMSIGAGVYELSLKEKK